MVTFNPRTASDRPALLEMNGTIYVAFASYGDADPYHGWIFGYSASNLSQTAVFNLSPNGQHGGIWGGPLASDGTFVYAATGNGTWDGGPDWGNSYLKLSPVSGTLSEADFFTPFNASVLDANDRDLGSALATLLPTCCWVSVAHSKRC